MNIKKIPGLFQKLLGFNFLFKDFSRPGNNTLNSPAETKKATPVIIY